MENQEQKKVKKKRTLLQRIVNIFLYTGIAIFILFVIAFGFSQTSTFRSYLKDLVIAQADSAMNGNLHISKIEGTIFTSLILKNAVVNMGKDTLLNAGTISIKTSPLHLLLKRIYVRQFEIRNASVSLIKDKSGEFNISRLFPPSKSTDTIKSTFPFTIEVAKLQLNNVNFSMQNYDKDGSKQKYDSLNMDDFRLQNIDLTLSAFADINENIFGIGIDNLNTLTNIKNFFVNNLSGNFSVNEEGIKINDFKVETNRSSFLINSSISKFSPFDSTSDFNTADINLNLDADSVNFADLTAFVPSTNILKGRVGAKVKTSGSLHKLNIDELEIKYDSTMLMAKGDIRNLDHPADMIIRTSFYNSYANQNDVNKLLPSIKVPVFPALGLLKFDTLIYNGKPLDFNSTVYLKTEKGDIAVNAGLNLSNPVIQYDVSFKTINFDASPFTGFNTNLNSHGNIKGKGVSPKDLSANVNYVADGSTFNGSPLDILRLKVSAKSKDIKYRFRAASDNMNTTMTGNFDFTDSNPSYKLNGRVKDLNVAKITMDTSLTTSLNFSITAEGNNFDLNKLNLFLNLKLYNSYVNNIHIDSTRAIVDLRSNDKGHRIINIISDLADITLDGSFSINQAVNLLSAEADFLSYSVKNKINEFLPSPNNIQTENKFINKNLFAPVDTSSDIQYLIDLKNFELISLLMGSNQLEVDGELSGEIKNNKDSVQLSLKSRLDYVKFWDKEEVFFLSHLNLNFNLKNAFNANSLHDVYANLNLKTDRVFTGKDIKNLLFSLDLSGNNAKLYLTAGLENNTEAKISGDLDFNGNKINLSLDTLGLKYNKFSLLNNGIIDLAYSGDTLEVNNLFLKRENGTGEIAVNGILSQGGNQKLKVQLKNFRGKDLSQNLLELNPGNTLLGSINLNADIEGDLENPLLNVDADIDSVTYKSKSLGALKSYFNYKDKSLSVDLRFIDSITNNKKPQLLVTGSVPLDLGIKNNVNWEVTEKNSKTINLKLIADNFNLAPFGNVIPNVRELRGILVGKLNITGTFDNIDPEGSIILKNAAFIADANNLEYNAGIKINVDKNELTLDSLLIENSKNTEYGGKMTGTGKATLDNLDIVSSKFNINGSLKVLSLASKSVSPTVYGDLVVASNGNIEFTMDKNEAFIKAPINITHADLIFPQAQGGYQSNLQDYIYRYAQNGSNKDGKSIDFESLVKIAQEQSNNKANNNSEGFNFNYLIDVNVEKEVKIVFILSKELDQKLTATLSGNFKYEKNGSKTSAQGELNLLEGSKLQFFKTLSAEGSVKFQNQLDNPYLDIVATYTGYYADSTSQEEKVAVKISIQGPLKELNKNFIQEKNNIAVYVGQSAIDNNEPTPGLDASDAIYFIIRGEFLNPKYKTASGSSDLATTSLPLAGSLLGNFLNAYFGDYVRTVQIRQVRGQTRISLTGKVQEFRYTIGGSTDVFQDLNQANVMIEYPIFKSLLVRLERKEALHQTGLQNDMINELGLKYKFEF